MGRKTISESRRITYSSRKKRYLDTVIKENNSRIQRKEPTFHPSKEIMDFSDVIANDPKIFSTAKEDMDAGDAYIKYLSDWAHKVDAYKEAAANDPKMASMVKEEEIKAHNAYKQHNDDWAKIREAYSKAIEEYFSDVKVLDFKDSAALEKGEIFVKLFIRNSVANKLINDKSG